MRQVLPGVSHAPAVANHPRPHPSRCDMIVHNAGKLITLPVWSAGIDGYGGSFRRNRT